MLPGVVRVGVVVVEEDVVNLVTRGGRRKSEMTGRETL